MSACIGEPISWLRLERYALGELEGGAARAVAEHVEACAVCRTSLGSIEGDRVDVPRLVAPAPAPRRWWLRPRLAWVGGLLAAAVLLLLLVGRDGAPPPAAERRARIKGGEVVLSIVRERDGTVVLDAHSFRTTDRLKVRITCTPTLDGAPLSAEVVVFQGPASFPVPTVALFCGNDVTLPGAFRLTDAEPATICIALGDRAPDRALLARRGPRGANLACLTISPE